MAEKWNHCGIPPSDGGPNRDLPISSDKFSGKFPEGLRVLVFDEDLDYVMILENQLQEYQYEVTRCNEEERAMYLLRNHSNRFDIAIIQVQNADGDRLQLISELGSEMNIPIIVMSKDDSAESVINWMRNGAWDYLIKPIKPEDLRLIFKHVVKANQGKRCVVAGEVEEKAATAEKSSSVGDSAIRNPNKRKRDILLDEPLKQEENYYERDRASTSKKRRVVWDEELHNKFIEAVELLGPDKAVPKKILELMNVQGITRENVASHLQKYRMNLKKQNVQNEIEVWNQSLITPQEGRMYGEEEARGFYSGSNVQFQPHNINNVLQPSVQHNTNPSLMTTFISPLGHHDGVSVAVSCRNLVMTHQHNQQTSEFAYAENARRALCYSNYEMHNEDEVGVANLTRWFTHNSEEMGLFQLTEPMIATNTAIHNDHHLSSSLEVTQQKMINIHETRPSMMHLPSYPSSYTHSSFVDQQENSTMVDENGGFNNNSSYSVDNNELN